MHLIFVNCCSFFFTRCAIDPARVIKSKGSCFIEKKCCNLLATGSIGDKTFIADKLCQLYIVYDQLLTRDRGADHSVQWSLVPKNSSETFRKIVVGSDNWVSKTARHLATRSPLSLRIQSHRKEWLPPSWASRNSQSVPRPDNKSGPLVGNWVHSPRSIRYCLPRVRLSIRSPLSSCPSNVLYVRRFFFYSRSISLRTFYVLPVYTPSEFQLGV